MSLKKKYTNSYDDIISAENLLLAWREFHRGKKHKKDVQEFEHKLMENILLLHHDLKNKTYTHIEYKAFKINDPKPRDIHKATVRDRVLHHALYRKLSLFYFKLFISDSYSCQIGKGTHKALKRFEYFHRKVSKNNTKQCFVLKCDIRKFFASIDHTTLIRLLDERIVDKDIALLLTHIMDSFNTSGYSRKGLPLGNLTSQILVNIYMHEFDMYVKQILKVKHYIRYADDFVILSQDRKYLENILVQMHQFLEEKLRLQLHPHKVEIRKVSQGIDFLGYVILPHAIVLRTKTKKRIKRKVKEGVVAYGKNRIKREIFTSIISSYLGVFSHAKSRKATGYLRMILEKLRDSP
jgi:retron-type reverse transcriptase